MMTCISLMVSKATLNSLAEGLNVPSQVMSQLHQRWLRDHITKIYIFKTTFISPDSVICEVARWVTLPNRNRAFQKVDIMAGFTAAVPLLGQLVKHNSQMHCLSEFCEH